MTKEEFIEIYGCDNQLSLTNKAEICASGVEYFWLKQYAIDYLKAKTKLQKELKALGDSAYYND